MTNPMIQYILASTFSLLLNVLSACIRLLILHTFDCSFCILSTLVSTYIRRLFLHTFDAFCFPSFSHKTLLDDMCFSLWHYRYPFHLIHTSTVFFLFFCLFSQSILYLHAKETHLSIFSLSSDFLTNFISDYMGSLLPLSRLLNGFFFWL